MKSKRGFMWDQIGWAIIAVAVLAVIVLGILILQSKGINLIEKIKEIFRFGR